MFSFSIFIFPSLHAAFVVIYAFQCEVNYRCLIIPNSKVVFTCMKKPYRRIGSILGAIYKFSFHGKRFPDF